MTETMNDCDCSDFPGFANKQPDLLELFQRHRFVTLVLEVKRALPFRVIAHDSFKHANRPVRVSQHSSRDRLGVDPFACDLVEFPGPANQTAPPLTGGKIATSS